MERQVIDMNMKTMDGLIGARMNIDMMDVPIRVYKEARLKGDTATMERAMDYAGKCSDKAWEYEAKADEGMKEEAKEEREKAKEKAQEELEERIEKRKEEQKAEAEALVEKMQGNGGEKTTDVPQTKPDGEDGPDSGTGTEGEAAQEGGTDAATEPVKMEMPDKKPVLYTSTGQAKTMPEQGPGINISVSV